MALMNIDEWKRERGLPVGDPGAETTISPGPPPQDPDRIAVLEAEIARQEALIVQLQAALRELLEKKSQVLERSTTPKTARVRRKPRLQAIPSIKKEA